jgi:hypothetical protein
MDRVRRGDHDLTGLPDALRQVVAAALDPEPARRPDLDEIRDWLNPDDTITARIPVPAAEPDDLFTMPLAIAAQAGVAQTVSPTAPTEARPSSRVPELPGTWVLDGDQPPPAYERRPHTLDPSGWVGPPLPPPAPRAERARRAVLLGAGAVALAAGVAAYPYLVIVGLLLLVWLLRSGSMTASATGDRQRMRGGARWYDVVVAPLSAPWHLVRSMPTTFLLFVWSGGFAVAAALLCYAFSVSVELTLFISGLALVAALYLGPGGSRVRRPLARLVNPVSLRPRTWLVAVALVLVIALVLGLVSEAGVHWTPASGAPGS